MRPLITRPPQLIGIQSHLGNHKEELMIAMFPKVMWYMRDLTVAQI